MDSLPYRMSEVSLVFGTSGDIRASSLGEAEASGELKLVPLEFIDEARVLAGADPAEVIRPYIGRHSSNGQTFRGALPIWDEDVPAADKINVASRVATYSVVARDPGLMSKSEVYRRLSSSGVEVPKFKVLGSVDELRRELIAADGKKAGLIVKPSVGSGAHGVYHPSAAEDPDVVVRTYSYFRVPDISFNSAPLPNHEIVVADYIDWDGKPIEVTADGYIKKGRIELFEIFECLKIVERPPIHDELMVTPPLTPAVAKKTADIRSVVEKSLTALGVTDSVFHIEIRLTETGIFPIDINLRPGGGLVPQALFRRTGLDIRLVHILTYLRGPGVMIPRGPSGGQACAIAGLRLPKDRIGDRGQITQLDSALKSDKACCGYRLLSTASSDSSLVSDVNLWVGFADSTPSGAVERITKLSANFGLE